MEMRETSSGGHMLGFWSLGVVDHVCVVGFISRRLDLHKSERGGTNC